MWLSASKTGKSRIRDGTGVPLALRRVEMALDCGRCWNEKDVTTAPGSGDSGLPLLAEQRVGVGAEAGQRHRDVERLAVAPDEGQARDGAHLVLGEAHRPGPAVEVVREVVGHLN